MTMDFTIDAVALKAGEKLFRSECRFIAGATSPDIMPPDDTPQVAFIGRSNVGKSSLINALTGRRSLARTSNTPGRTQQINFFALDEGRLQLVDLPGYGFAAASKEKIGAWTGLIRAYFRHRRCLKRVCILVDARRGLKDSDHEMMTMLDGVGVSYVVVLTKTDKIKAAALAALIPATAAALKTHVCAFPHLFATSADDKSGIAELRAALYLLSSLSD